MTLRNTLAAGAAMLPLALLSTPAFAQSTGSQDFENEIVVTGTSTKNGVAGVIAPDTTKAKVVLTQEFIARQSPGQTINDVINQLPGVSFQNNDPFGSAGGKMTIRGFDNTRISQTFDGIPLNDSGNYALYSNQQLDPELIEQVNVNLGSTDVDSPTAAASGSTVNYRTRTPGEEFGVKLVGSAGDFNFFRVFGMIDTGVLTPWGTRAFISGSSSTNDTVFSNVDQPTFKAHRGRINKKQFNAKIYQPIGDDGDFVAVSGHYNENRNNFFGSVPLRNDANRVVGSASTNRFPLTRDERDYGIARCQINTAARPGVADVANSCGSTFDERMNPSNTGNIRVNSRFTLAPGLVLTVDPSFQYVKANGGGTVVGQEARRDVNPTGGAANCNTTANGAAVSCQTGYIGGVPYYGRDLNGDGDLLDTVRVLAPSQTGTHRYGVIAGLRYELDDANTFRVFYSLDRARHRQTGETNFLQLNGQPTDPFPINDPLTDVNGNVLEKRDRKSIATLNLFGGEYRGEFGQLTVQVGGSYKMFKRDLNNYCATSSATGFVECFGTNDAGLAAWLAANPTVVVAPGVTAPVQGPQQRIRKYNKFTPNVGLTFDATDALSVFANYSKGVQVPGTDNLYNAFYFPTASEQANPKPETTDNFDVGVRYTTSKIQGQLGLWYTIFNDRLASSFDPETERNVYRNLGRVDKYGIDASISYRPIPEFSVYAFGSYLKSKIKDDVVNGVCSAVSPTCAAIGDPIYALTKGKRESGSPTFTLGGRVQGQLGPVELGAQIKRTGPRYVNDQNLPLVQTINNVVTTVWGAKAPAYTLVDLDARVGLDWAGLGDKVYFQFNVTNLFDKLYVGGFDGQLANNTVPNVNIGAPRTFIGSLIVGF
ncbi:TonB-dependent receptor [Sphingopyxis sp. BSN-002]|uniref:TonB-dependent receptor n=1 Tax=Sphingopyxis sp. BSN-002 TaxID=2911495 RepID=UPI001EDBDC66|nr:TonB-dependent receptor [Sphingopyxis sp. BSN-002]UKK83501.1 TonB-dependent receptor [Sphingopyxis sp. BSN-002]